MRTAYIIRNIGMVLLINAVFMLLSAIIGIFNGFDTGVAPLLLSFVIIAVIGLFPILFVPAERNMTSRESYIVVLASWMTSCVIGTLPYLMWGGEFTLVDALFESVSGYTTTGATILNDVEVLPRSILFWRASTHWIGGIGVVLFALVIVPSIGRQKMSLSSVELSTLAKDNFRYNTKKILQIVIGVYVGLTLAQMGALMLVGMNWFEAIAHSFSTISTGGFSTRNLSIMGFNSLSIEIVVMFFMLISGIHFGLIYATFRGKGVSIWRSDAARYYILALVVGSILVAFNLFMSGNYDNFWTALRYGFFQTISYGTTTGFASADAALWPAFTVLLLTVYSIQCAMAGSTTGGVKADRVLLLFKAIKVHILKMQHPSAVIRVKLGGHSQDSHTVQAAAIMIGFYLLAVVVSTAFLTMFDIDLLTSFTATVSSLGNVGPGFGDVSNLNNMDFFNPVIKMWLSLMMLFGRLELFGLIHLFMLRSWK